MLDSMYSTVRYSNHAAYDIARIAMDKSSIHVFDIEFFFSSGPSTSAWHVDSRVGAASASLAKLKIYDVWRQ